MATLQQLQAGLLLLLRESSDDSHFTSEEQTGFLNEAKDFLATLSNQANDLFTVTTTLNVGAYPLPSDSLLINSVYYGNELVAGDTYRLKSATREILGDLFPGWLDETITAAGKPSYYMKLDQNTLYIHPRPDADSAGKKIFLFYGYLPANMSSAADEPDIPLIYHNILKFYAAYLGYLNLSNKEMATEMFGAFMAHYNMLKATVDKEVTENFRWKWGSADL